MRKIETHINLDTEMFFAKREIDKKRKTITKTKRKKQKLKKHEIKGVELKKTIKDDCIIKKLIDKGKIKDKYRCYLTDEICFCESIGCYWLK